MAAERVLVGGWYGAGNLGDEMLLDLFIRWCREKGAEPAAISIDPSATERMHGIAAVDIFDLEAVLGAMREADLFALGGGGLLQTHHNFTLRALYDFSAADIGSYVRPMLMARQLGVPTLFWAQGLGPLAGDEPRAVVRDLLSWVGHASLRDAGSLALVRELGCTRDFPVAPDPAWAWPLPDAGRRLPGAVRRIAIVPRSWHAAPEWPDRFLEALRSQFAPGQASIVWMVSQANAVPGRASDDVEFIRGMMARLGDGYEQSLVIPPSPSAWAETLAGCDAAIVMRMHAQILALRLGLPLLAIEYDPKMAVVSSDAGLPERHRVDVASPPEEWERRMADWLAPASINEARPSPVVARLEGEALVHKRVLHAALASAGRSHDRVPAWRSEGVDWIAEWRRAALEAELGRARLQLEALSQRLGEAEAELARLRGP